MEKYYSSSLLNFLALFGWINLSIEVLRLMTALLGHPAGFSNYNILTHNFLASTVYVFLTYLGLVLFVFWCQRFRPINEGAFCFPYQKIKRSDLFYIYFFGGLLFMIAPFAALIALGSN